MSGEASATTTTGRDAESLTSREGLELLGKFLSRVVDDIDVGCLEHIEKFLDRLSGQLRGLRQGHQAMLKYMYGEMYMNPDFQQLAVKGNRDRSRTPVLGDDRQPPWLGFPEERSGGIPQFTRGKYCGSFHDCWVVIRTPLGSVPAKRSTILSQIKTEIHG
jgi:hypothetical protein